MIDQSNVNKKGIPNPGFNALNISIPPTRKNSPKDEEQKQLAMELDSLIVDLIEKGKSDDEIAEILSQNENRIPEKLKIVGTTKYRIAHLRGRIEKGSR